MEATSGFEPEDGGFADLCLTTWLRRRLERETGFEPATSTLARLHSTTELLPLNSEELFTMTTRICQALLEQKSKLIKLVCVFQWVCE